MVPPVFLELLNASIRVTRFRVCRVIQDLH